MTQTRVQKQEAVLATLLHDTRVRLGTLPPLEAQAVHKAAIKAVVSGAAFPTPFDAASGLPVHARRELLWRLYEPLVPRGEAKRLGQYFTPDDVCVAALSALADPRHILDPAMGHGAFLKHAHHLFPKASLVGIEIDERLRGVPELVLGKTADLHYLDFFDWLAGRQTNEISHCFDAVVGNPPYVSYQALSEVRADRGDTYRNHILGCLRQAAKRSQAPAEFLSMLDELSGYSDLSAYVLAGAWLVLGQRGALSFVMSNHWLERDYGKPLIDFLERTGSLRVVAADPDRSWFAAAQVPTSIVVYDKGVTRKGPVPILWPRRENLARTRLRNVVAGVNDYNGFSNLSEGESMELGRDGLTEAGWQVRQGLRTGCNGFFYVKMKTKRKAVARLNKDEAPHEFDVAPSFLRPAIVRLSQTAPLELREDDADAHLLDLSGFWTRDEIAKESRSKPRRAQRTLKALPDPLDQFVSLAAVTQYKQGKLEGVLIPDLSAVKTNQSDARSAESGRAWYHLSLQPRHFGALIVPRVSYGLLRTYLVNQEEAVVTDANFVTLVPGAEPKVSTGDLWLLMNSNVFRETVERIGTVLGGGAFKLEAARLKNAPVPVFKAGTTSRTKARLTRMLRQPGLSDAELAEIGQEIDMALVHSTGADARRQRLQAGVAARRRTPTRAVYA